MNRQTFVMVILLLAILIGGIALQRQRFNRSEVAVLPPTAGEPAAPATAVAPMQPAETAGPLTPLQKDITALSAEMVQSRQRDPRFWGNRGYVVKDSASTFIPPSQLEALKREFLSTSQ